jgi:hypothetical protein
MPRLSAIAPDVTFPLDYHGITIEVTCRPVRFSTDLLHEMRKAQEDDSQVIAQVAELVVDWDVTDDDDEVIPPDAEHLAALPIQLVTEVFEGIITEVMEGGKASGSTSSRKVRRAAARNGTSG